MISIRKNESFPSWIQVRAFGQVIEEVQGRAKAMRIAKQLAKDHNETHVVKFGKAVKVI